MKAVSLTQTAVEVSTAPVSSEPSETLRRIEDRRTADYLMDPKRGWRYFWPFLDTERSPSEVSRLIDAPLNQLHYHIKIMLELDLIRATRNQVRAGRPIRFYRSSFEACFIPFPTTSAESFEALIARNDALWGRWLSSELARVWSSIDGQWGWHCSRNPEGAVRLEERPQRHHDQWNPLAADAPSVLNHWGVLALEETQAKCLQREMNELFERYLKIARTTPRNGPHKNYLVHAAIAPSDP